MKYKQQIKIGIEFRPWSSNICISGTPKIKKQNYYDYNQRIFSRIQLSNTIF